MWRTKGKGIVTERIICDELRRKGLSFDHHVTSLPDQPDVLSEQGGFAVFIDVDLWYAWKVLRIWGLIRERGWTH